MTKRLTNEEFVAKAKAKHGGVYSYEGTQYIRGVDKVDIMCSLHGKFQQTGANHLNGQGCPACSVKARAATHRYDTAEFVRRAKAVHRETYDYNDTVYINSASKVAIVCATHGKFEQSPSFHLVGGGCPSCSQPLVGIGLRKTQEDFLAHAKRVHSDKYDYTDSVYITATHKIDIKCRIHGVFSQLARDHLNLNRGCPACGKSGYDRSKSGTLYILSCADITKIGITNLDPITRVKDISRSHGRQFTLEQFWTFDDGKVADNLETTLLTSLKSQYKQPTDKFDGYTECFYDVDMRFLLGGIESELRALH